MQAYQADPTAPYGPYQEAEASRPLTIDDVVTKTGITLAVLSISAVVSYFLVASDVRWRRRWPWSAGWAAWSWS